MTGPKTAMKDEPITVTVTDGMTDTPLAGAIVNGASTNASGEATLSFQSYGIKKIKAERQDSIRSNAIYILVT